jgi:hypothetical protein
VEEADQARVVAEIDGAPTPSTEELFRCIHSESVLGGLDLGLGLGLRLRLWLGLGFGLGLGFAFAFAFGLG